MMFLFKRKKVVVDAFISNKFAHAYDYAPIDYADKFYPDWWKNLPKVKIDFDKMNRDDETMRLCAGFVDHYKRGLILPMWSDLMIKTEPPDRYYFQFSDETSTCQSHSSVQRQGFYDDHINIKIISPWLLRSEKDVYFTFLPPMWNNIKKPEYETAIGTVNFYYQNSTHINLLIKSPKNIFIPFNQPILHMMPLTEREVVIKRHLVSEEEWHRENRRMISLSFFGAYFKLKKHRENMEQKSKCPFHFK